MKDEDDFPSFKEAFNEEKRDFDVTVEIPLTIRFKVRASNQEEAEDAARDELREMFFKTYLHNYTGKSSAEMLGIENKRGQPCNDVSFDYPERPNMGEITIEEA